MRTTRKPQTKNEEKLKLANWKLEVEKQRTQTIIRINLEEFLIDLKRKGLLNIKSEEMKDYVNDFMKRPQAYEVNEKKFVGSKKDK